MKKPVVLRIYKGEQLLGVKQFIDSQIVIGRQGEVQVALEGDNVAIIHAVIEERDGGGHYICDLGSESGTYRNGEMVLDTQIQSGDTLQIGDYRIEFYLGVPKPKAPPPGLSSGAEAPAPAASSAPEPAPVKPIEPTPSVPQAPPFEPVAVPKESPAAQTLNKEPKPQAPPVVKQEFRRESLGPDTAPSPQVPVSKPAVAEPPKPEVAEPPKVEAKTEVKPAASSVQAAASTVVGGTVTGFSLAGPKAKSTAHKSGEKKHRRFGSTFAPPSRYNDVREYVRPSKGTVVEVLVAWRERVIATHHFSEKRTITMGSHPENDIVLPMFASRARRVPILKISSQAVVLISPEMSGELIRGQSSSTFIELVRQNRMAKDGAAYALILEQGEMIRIELNDQISVIVRYVSESPKPMVAPLLDLTTSEFTGVVLSFVLVAVLGLYMFLYTPPLPLPDEGLENEPLRTAMIITAKPTPAPLPPAPPKPERPAPTPAATPPPQIVKATPQPKKTEDKKVSQPKAVKNLTKKNDPGLSANAAPNKNKTGPRHLTAPKSGGAIKTAAKEGSQMKSAQKDPSKSGVFSVFGTNGAQDQLAQSTSGAGELAGLADQATGKAGSSENRPGQGLGSKLKDTGRGGTGNALTGIAGGISTAGRGSGNSGYGTGGLGNHSGVKIVPGGEEESFSGTIDREAIRRVIQANLRVIKTCYERQLNRNPDLFGKVVIAWEIGEQGRVVSARIGRDELGNRAVGDCIVAKLKGWRFPEPPANQQVEVAYPFFFSN